MPDHPLAVFPHLDIEQAEGLLCVVCRRDFFAAPIDNVPVGTSATTRKEVRACRIRCAPLVGYVPPAEQLELEAGR